MILTLTPSIFALGLDMSTAFRRIRRSGRTIAATALALTAASMSACTDAHGKPNLFGIPLPSISKSSGDDLTERENRDLGVFNSVVRNPSADIDPEMRVSAAESMIAMDIQPATDRLCDALRSGEPVVVSAVIDAIEASPEPIGGLLAAVTETLSDASEEQMEKLYLVLPRYGDEALALVAAAARDRDESPARRVGPISALAAFRSREAAVQLMAMLQEPEPQPPEIIAATGASLEKLTGLPYGAEADQWRRWWDKLKDEPIENWLRVMVLHLSTRTAELERASHRQTVERHEIAMRFTAILRELFLGMPADEQIARLPDLLTDDLAPVRAFALGRIERRLRDSERIPEAVQEKLAGRLADTDELPDSRLLAGRLLNELNYPGTAYLVANALVDEKDAAIVAGYMNILAKRPSPTALPHVLRWLNDSTAGDAAADALWTMVVREIVATDDAFVRRTVRLALQWQTEPSPKLIRLLAAVGDQSDRERVEELLDARDNGLRHAAAEGLAFAGKLEPLLRRAADPQIYPLVIRLIAAGSANVETVRSLAALVPPEGHRQRWAQTIRTTADAMPPADLIAVDQVLATYDHVDPTLRADILARVPGVSSDALTTDQRSELLVRLARLRIDLREYKTAYEVLDWPNGAPTTPALLEIKFEATILSGRYEEAAEINDDVMVWLALLDTLIGIQPSAAGGVRDEIRSRFPNELQFEAGEVFRAAEQRLLEATVTAGVDSGSTE